MAAFTESVVENAALGWLGALGYKVEFGPNIAPGEPAAERDDYGEVVLPGRLPGRWRGSIPKCRQRRWTKHSAS